MSFGVGDEVVCINDNEPPQGEGPRVVKGQHYTVTAIHIKPRVMGQMAPGIFVMKPEYYVHLAEVPSPKGVGFFAFRFRKVEKKSDTTDISIFKEIADGTRTVPLEDVEPVKVKEKVE
jgi:hypothetical protein